MSFVTVSTRCGCLRDHQKGGRMDEFDHTFEASLPRMTAVTEIARREKNG